MGRVLRTRTRGEFEPLAPPDTYTELVKSTSINACWAAMDKTILSVVRVKAAYMPFEYQSITDSICDASGDNCMRTYNPVENHRISYTNQGRQRFPNGFYPRKNNCSLYGKAQYVMFWAYPLGAARLRVKAYEAYNKDGDFRTSFTDDELTAAVARITPSVATVSGVDATNVYTMLLEIGDVKKLLPGLLSTIGVDSKRGRKLNFVASPDRSITNSAATGWLTWNWGVNPLVKDLNALDAATAAVDKTVKIWNDYAHKRGTLAFHDTIAASKSELSHTIDNVVNNYDVDTIEISEMGTAEYTAKLSLYVQPIKLTAKETFTLRLEQLGLNKPLSGIWEAVPYSWLADYVGNIGSLIEEMESQADTILRYKFVSAGISEKTTTYYARLETRNAWAGSWTPVDENIEESTYTRVPIGGGVFAINSNSSFQVATDTLRPNQVMNLASVFRKIRH